MLIMVEVAVDGSVVGSKSDEARRVLVGSVK